MSGGRAWTAERTPHSLASSKSSATITGVSDLRRESDVSAERCGAERARRPAPAVVVEAEIADGLTAVSTHAPDGGRYDAASILVRVFTEPVALLMVPLSGDGLSVAELGAVIEVQCGEAVRRRMDDAGVAWAGHVPTNGLQPLARPSYLASRDAVLAKGPRITVAISTRNRSDRCRRMLESLESQGHPPAHVLIVDNAPIDDSVRQLAGEFSNRLELSYVVEPRPGLSWARNCAIDNSTTEVLAWVDDDEVCDRLVALRRAEPGVRRAPAGGRCIRLDPAGGARHTPPSGSSRPTSGPIAASVDSRRRSSHPLTTRHARQNPLYPLPPFGAGGNMAFRRDAIERIGRFDCALGAGTLSHGGRGHLLRSLCCCTRAGPSYIQPTAFVYHPYHHRDYQSLQRVFTGYGRGLTAFYTSLLVRHPLCHPATLAGLKHGRAMYEPLFERQQAPCARSKSTFPRELIRANLRGMLEGPLMYGRARRRARQLRMGARP